MNQKKFAMYTESMLKKLPYWFKARKNSKDSITAKFLNVFGLTFDEIRDILEYSFTQVYLSYTDVNMIDILYKGYFNEFRDYEDIEAVYYNCGVLIEAENLQELFGDGKFIPKKEAISSRFSYFVDIEKKIIYVNSPYGKDSEFKYGSITVKYKDGTLEEVPLYLHHVWNFLDEFGALFWCPRLQGELNVDYKNRLLDVFRNPSNSSRDGLLNGIARELSLKEYLLWEDTSENFIIKEKMVALNKIKVGNVNLDLSEVFISSNGSVVIRANDSYPKDIMVEFIHGVEMHRLNNREDIKLCNELYNNDGSPTELLLEYKKAIETLAPIKWGQFVWSNAYFDFSDKNVGGDACIKNTGDSSINGFVNFKK